MAKLTLWGLEKFVTNRGDESIFAQLKVHEDMNREVVINNILIECGEFEVLYSDPDFLRLAIGQWSLRKGPTFGKWWIAWTELNKFNPLDNYDRTEETTVKNGGTVTLADVGNNKSVTTNTGSVTTASSGKNTDYVSAYNSDELRVDNQNASSGEDKTTNNLDTKVVDDNTFDRTTTNDLETVTTSRIHGNVGVTKTTDIWSDFTKAVDDLNPYKMIVDSFKTSFCILTY